MISLENKTSGNLVVPGFSLMLPSLITEELDWDFETAFALVSGGDDLQAVIDDNKLEIKIPDPDGAPMVVTNVGTTTLTTSLVKLQYYSNQNIPKNSVRFMKTPGHNQLQTVVPIVLERAHNLVGISVVTERADPNQSYEVALYKEARDTPVWVADLLEYPSDSEYSTWSGMKIAMTNDEEYAIGIRQSTSVNQNSKFKKISITLSLEVV